MRFIIYAAGVAKRLSHDSKPLLKGLIDLEGRKIIEYQLMWMNKYNPQSVVIVLGNEHEEFKKFLGKKYLNLNIDYVYNDDYKTKGNMLSLWAARDYCDQDVLFTTSDLLANPCNIYKFMEDPSLCKILVDSKSTLLFDDDPVKVEIQSEKVVHTLKNKTHLNPHGIAIGVYKLSQKAIKDLLDKIEYKIHIGDDNKSLYYAIDEILDGHEVRPVYCENSEWFDIDTREDLERARKYLKNNQIYC